MATGAAEVTTGVPPTPRPSAPRKSPVVRRRRSARGAETTSARFFLVKASSNGSLELGQEIGSESEAIVESFRGGGSFAVVTEWKPVADLSTGIPVIKKEAIVLEKKSLHS